MAKKQIKVCMHSTIAEVWLSNRVLELLTRPGVDCYDAAVIIVNENIKELNKLEDEFIVKYLRSFDCWNTEELTDRPRNLTRVIWTLAGNVKDEKCSGTQKDNWAYMSEV